MDALTPQPSTEPLPAGPRCEACGDTALVSWRRRLTADELAEHIAQEQSRRDHARLLADPQLPPPLFPPLPTGEDDTRTIYACGPHAIHMDAAALIHASTCTAPNEAHLPDCDCTPEPLPEDPPEAPAAELPAHWQTRSI